MFIKDNTFDIKHRERVQDRFGTPILVSSSPLDEHQYAHIRTLILSHFATEASQPLFQTWINNVFCKPSSSKFDLTELSNLIKEYKDSYRTKDFIADIMEAIKSTDFNSAANKKFFGDHSDDYFLGKVDDIFILKHLNPTTDSGGVETYQGPTGVIVNYLRNQLHPGTGVSPTDLASARQIAIDYITEQLKTFGIADLNDPDVADLKTYLNSQGFITEFQGVINTALAASESQDSILNYFVKKDSFKTKLIEAIKMQLDTANAGTHLPEEFNLAVGNALQKKLVPHINNLVSSIGKNAAESLVGHDLTLTNIKALVPGINTFFDARPAAYNHMKWWLVYNPSKTHVTLSAQFRYAANNNPVNLLTSDPSILINDDRPILDIAKERLQYLLRNQVVRLKTDGDLIKDIKKYTLTQWLTGQYQEITLDEFKALSGSDLDDTTWHNEVGTGKNFKYTIEAKLDTTSHKVLYRFILKDDAALIEADKTKVVDITDNQVLTQFQFMYERVINVVKTLQDDTTHQHNLFIMGEHPPVITSPTRVQDWYLRTLDIMQDGPIKSVLVNLKTQFGDQIFDGRFQWEAFVDRFDPTDETMDLKVTLTDTGITLADGTHPKVTQVYSLRTKRATEIEHSHDIEALRVALEQFVGLEGSNFESTNSPGTHTVDVGTDTATWDAAATSLSTQIDVGSQVDGYHYHDFKSLYDEFFNKDIHLQWDTQIMRNPVTNSGGYGLNFYFRIKYYDDIFHGTAAQVHQVSLEQFQELERVNATPADIQQTISDINNEKTRLQDIVKTHGSTFNEIVTGIEGVASRWISIINGKHNISKRELANAKKNALDEMHSFFERVEPLLGEPWLIKLREMFHGHIPQNLEEIFIRHKQLFKPLVENGESLDTIMMLINHSRFIEDLDSLDPGSVGRIVEGITSFHQNYKYTYLGLGIGLGAAGALSGGLAVSSIRANSKLNKINNKQMKMRGTKIVSAVSTIVSLSTIASSVVFMFLFFANKGGF